LLILDEPTNDLDIETLELLEEVVANYAGTVILVSHDRDFVNNCVNTCLYFDGTGHINQIVGGYDDVDSYLALKEERRQRQLSDANKKESQPSTSTSTKKEATKIAKKKLSFKESNELEALPEIIDSLETSVAELQEQVNQGDFFNQDEKITKEILNQLSENESKLDLAYSRWQELDEH